MPQKWTISTLQEDPVDIASIDVSQRRVTYAGRPGFTTQEEHMADTEKYATE